MVDNLVKQTIGRFDQVRIITTRNVNYVSAPPGTKLKPNGVWSVAAILNNEELLCVRKSITIKIPINDVLKIVGYDLSEIVKKFGKLSHGEKRQEKRPEQ